MCFDLFYIEENFRWGLRCSPNSEESTHAWREALQSSESLNVLRALMFYMLINLLGKISHSTATSSISVALLKAENTQDFTDFISGSGAPLKSFRMSVGKIRWRKDKSPNIQNILLREIK